jgi:hypothetical protein
VQTENKQKDVVKQSKDKRISYLYPALPVTQKGKNSATAV